MSEKDFCLAGHFIVTVHYVQFPTCVPVSTLPLGYRKCHLNSKNVMYGVIGRNFVPANKILFFILKYFAKSTLSNECRKITRQSHQCQEYSLVSLYFSRGDSGQPTNQVTAL